MNYDRLKNIHQKHSKYILPIKPGMFLEIHENVWEWDTKRIWKFKWLVIKVKKPNHPDGTFTIRGEVARMTIEKIYPLSFPNFEKVILLDNYKIRRSKLYYIRDKVGKDARFESLVKTETKGIDLLDGLRQVKEDTKVEKNNEQKVVEEKTKNEEDTVKVFVENKEKVEESFNDSVEEVIEEKVEEIVEKKIGDNAQEKVENQEVNEADVESEELWEE